MIKALIFDLCDTVVHTAGLIGRRVSASLTNSFEINVGGTANVAEAVMRAAEDVTVDDPQRRLDRALPLTSIFGDITTHKFGFIQQFVQPYIMD